MEDMTAKVSCFARAYHANHNTQWIFRDEFASDMLTEEEERAIAQSMTDGIHFFAPEFRGTPEEALRFIVDHQLAPSVLIRSVFCERALETERRLGCKQTVLFAAGLDTYALRAPTDMKVYELDREALLKRKQQRIQAAELKPKADTRYIACDLADIGWMKKLVDAGFDTDRKAYGSLLGLSYYLTKSEFEALVSAISALWCEGSAICFDYPVQQEGEAAQKNRSLAAAAQEKMQARYDDAEMRRLLQAHGFQIYEFYNEKSAEAEFCESYNRAEPSHRILPPEGVHYCLAVKKP